MEVTEIRRARGRVRIVMESETFVVPMEVFLERELVLGEDVDPDAYDQWLLPRLYKPALNYAVSLLAARAYTSGELDTRLKRMGYRTNVREIVLYKLQKHHLINDSEYAIQWVESRTRHGLGERRITQELLRKGLTREQAAAALQHIHPEEQLNQAVRLCISALRRAKAGEDPRKTTHRIMAMLARRGYSYEHSKSALAEAIRQSAKT